MQKSQSRVGWKIYIHFFHWITLRGNKAIPVKEWKSFSEERFLSWYWRSLPSYKSAKSSSFFATSWSSVTFSEGEKIIRKKNTIVGLKPFQLELKTFLLVTIGCVPYSNCYLTSEFFIYIITLMSPLIFFVSIYSESNFQVPMQSKNSDHSRMGVSSATAPYVYTSLESFLQKLTFSMCHLLAVQIKFYHDQYLKIHITECLKVHSPKIFFPPVSLVFSSPGRGFWYRRVIFKMLRAWHRLNREIVS